MPTYAYRCEDGHTFEVFQSITDDPVAQCEVCGKPVERVLFAPAVHFKGSGFYTTDYARKGAKPAGSDPSKNGDSKPSEAKPPDSKPEAKTGSEKKSSGSSDQA